MLQVLIEHPWVGWLLLTMLSISGTIIGFLIRNKVIDNDEKIKESIKEIHEIRDNYLDRFDKVDGRFIELQKNIHTNHITTMMEMGKVLTAVQSQSDFCRFIQENKKK